ncbi:polysaccharide biosynthesis tyrosine autokinase [Microbacterium limosum]|uniref:non-specific protein-tyrosine kinase n=1 Tax=Microbacterium limosum TaxID=3079935 RepID=A0AAU0MF95_9MICO|nr:polysaccharide biosynthesis tyrosine autokinase [Microbacterium sp. Y20]WOQ69215.1 polysaccharide biosynthesis tyrosine autokinase [Microbacterium sp. Y20]
MELSDYIRILRKNWLVIVALTLVGIGSAAAYSLTREPQYEATSQVFVSSQAGSTVAELQQGNTFTQARVTTYVNLVTTPIILNPVISDLGLENISANGLAEKVSASSPLNTTIISITVTDPSAAEAARLANAVAASLTEQVEDLETLPDSDASPIKLTLVKDADAPFVPVSPNVPLNLALGALVGLALGVGFAVLRTVLDTRIRSTRDVEAITERPIIGAIPFDPRAKERPIILKEDPTNPRSEAFRALRTNLQFLDMDGGHSFVITSSMPSEGKSTTAVNLAIALADAGKRVVLVDADLRKPKVHEYLGVEGGVGLTDVLIGRVHLTDVLQQWGSRSLYVLPAGKIPPNPSELLGSAQMHALLEAFSRDVDVVILDAPPLLPVTDAAVLAKRTSGAIVVVAAGDTSRHQLEGAIDALETVDAKVAGIVLTMVPTRGPDAYGYGYGYGYGGYGYGGHAPESPKPKPAKASTRRARRSAETAPEQVRTGAPKGSASIDDLL